MEKLDKKQIDTQHALTMSKLIGQANNLLNYELRRASLMCSDNFKKEFRNIELKDFDTPVKK